jgi:hypothetical protein
VQLLKLYLSSDLFSEPIMLSLEIRRTLVRHNPAGFRNRCGESCAFLAGTYRNGDAKTGIPHAFAPSSLKQRPAIAEEELR